MLKKEKKILNIENSVRKVLLYSSSDDDDDVDEDLITFQGLHFSYTFAVLGEKRGAERKKVAAAI